MRAYRYHHLPSHAAPLRRYPPDFGAAGILAIGGSVCGFGHGCLRQSLHHGRSGLAATIFCRRREQIAFNAFGGQARQNEHMLQSAKIRTKPSGQQPAPGPVGFRTVFAAQCRQHSSRKQQVNPFPRRFPSRQYRAGACGAMRTPGGTAPGAGSPQTLLPLLMQKMRERSLAAQQGQQANSAEKRVVRSGQNGCK